MELETLKTEGEGWLFLDFLNVDFSKDNEVKSFLKRADSYNAQINTIPAEFIIAAFINWVNGTLDPVTKENGPFSKNTSISEFICYYKMKLADVQCGLIKVLSQEITEPIVEDFIPIYLLEFEIPKEDHLAFKFGWLIKKFLNDITKGKLKFLAYKTVGSGNLFLQLLAHSVSSYNFRGVIQCGYCKKFIIKPNAIQIANVLDRGLPAYCSQECKAANRRKNR